MIHRAASSFWRCYDNLDLSIQALADKNFALLKDNPYHPSLHFKKVGLVWSARVGLDYRTIATEESYGFLWIWIGLHKEYDKLIG